MESALKNIITLTTGDWSADGHGMTDVKTIRTNRTVKELTAAYKKGSKVVDVDLDEDVASDYEDNSFPEEVQEKLANHGFSPKEYLSEYDEDDPCAARIDADGYARVWLLIAKVGDPELEFEEVERRMSNINIGGYGLFSL